MFDFYDGVKIIKDKSSKPIAIEWRFSDGTKSYYYLKEEDKEWIDDFVFDVLKENALSRKERYHCKFSLDECIYEGETFVDEEENLVDYLNDQQEEIDINAFFWKAYSGAKKKAFLQVKQSKNYISGDGSKRENEQGSYI